MRTGTLGFQLWSSLFGDSSSEYVPPPPPDPVPDNALIDDSGNYILYNGNYIVYDL